MHSERTGFVRHIGLRTIVVPADRIHFSNVRSCPREGCAEPVCLNCRNARFEEAHGRYAFSGDHCMWPSHRRSCRRGARAFTDAAALNRREIDLAGDVQTMPEAADILTESLGRPIAFAQTPIEPVRQYSKEMALMLEWFERVGYSADVAGLEREFGRALTKLPDWARRHAQPNGR